MVVVLNDDELMMTDEIGCVDDELNVIDQCYHEKTVDRHNNQWVNDEYIPIFNNIQNTFVEN